MTITQHEVDAAYQWALDQCDGLLLDPDDDLIDPRLNESVRVLVQHGHAGAVDDRDVRAAAEAVAEAVRARAGRFAAAQRFTDGRWDAAAGWPSEEVVRLSVACRRGSWAMPGDIMGSDDGYGSEAVPGCLWAVERAAALMTGFYAPAMDAAERADLLRPAGPPGTSGASSHGQAPDGEAATVAGSGVHEHDLDRAARGVRWAVCGAWSAEFDLMMEKQTECPLVAHFRDNPPPPGVVAPVTLGPMSMRLWREGWVSLDAPPAFLDWVSDWMRACATDPTMTAIRRQWQETVAVRSGIVESDGSPLPGDIVLDRTLLADINYAHRHATRMMFGVNVEAVRFELAREHAAMSVCLAEAGGKLDLPELGVHRAEPERMPEAGPPPHYGSGDLEDWVSRQTLHAAHTVGRIRARRAGRRLLYCYRDIVREFGDPPPGFRPSKSSSEAVRGRPGQTRTG